MRRVIPGAQFISRRVGLAVVIAVVLARSFTLLYWSDVYFDADQAVTGLMAKHIAEGRAFPVFQYGAQYVLVLEAWLAAPLMAISDASPALLKSVPVVLNVASATLLYAILTTGVVALSPVLALLATAPVALPAVSAANDLSSALGMNIEPLFFTLVIWLLRERPIALGVIAAIAIKNREFALYAVAALVFLDVLRDRSAALWRPRMAGLIAFALTWSLVAVVNQYSSPMGPGTNMAMFGDFGDNVAVATSALCIEPAKIPGDMWILATELLPLQYGVRSVGWRLAPHPGAQPPDASWLWLPLVAVLVFGVARGLMRAWRFGPSTLTWLGLYLVMVGLQAVIVYGTSRCGNASFYTMRYTLLSVLVAAGAIILALERESVFSVRAIVVGVCTFWIGVCVLGHLAVIRGFLASP
ncbi:MAG: hypothetical protein H0T71_09390, partial [Acidobacteria bacterium]|nr:hypothetical protein [Acidobacteriota bacterium]